MPAYAPTTAEVAYEEAIVNDPIWQSERPHLRRVLGMLRAARTDVDFQAVQLALVSRMKARQHTIAGIRQAIDELRRRRSDLAEREPAATKEEFAVLQAELSFREHQERVQRALHALLVTVGDALMWTRLDFDRASIAVLGHGQSVTWLSDDRGWDAELSAVDQLWQDGVLGLLTDMCSCVSVGDIVAFFADRIELREVKAGRSARSSSPQMRRIEAAVNLINNGETAEEGVRRVVVRAPTKYRTHLAQLPALVGRARGTGHVAARLSASQFVQVTDVANGGSVRHLDEDGVRRATRWRVNDLLLVWTTLDRRMRDRHHRFAFMAPLALLPLPLEALLDVLLGRLVLSTTVNVSAVARALRADGWDCQPIEPPESVNGFVRVSRTRASTRSDLIVAPHLRELMSIELMTAANLSAAVGAAFDLSPTAPDDTAHPMVVLSDERRVWRRRPE